MKDEGITEETVRAFQQGLEPEPELKPERKRKRPVAFRKRRLGKVKR